MREFKVIEVKEITMKNGNKFTAYKTVGKGGRKMDLRFVRTCKNIPTENCIICVNDEDCNVDTTRQYPILWIKNVQSIKPLGKKSSNIDEFFGEETADEEAPF